MYVCTYVNLFFTLKESCLAVAILLHYFFMAAFCWMLSEGVLLFIMLYFVFYKGIFKRKRFFFAIGWGKKNLCTCVHTYNELRSYMVINLLYVCIYFATYVHACIKWCTVSCVMQKQPRYM